MLEQVLNNNFVVCVDFFKVGSTFISYSGLQNGYNLPFSYYEALSWHGLTETADFDTLYPEYIGDELNLERITLKNTMAAEQNNQPSDTEIPSGNPCPN
jgi:hypothetical protein